MFDSFSDFVYSSYQFVEPILDLLTGITNSFTNLKSPSYENISSYENLSLSENLSVSTNLPLSENSIKFEWNKGLIRVAGTCILFIFFWLTSTFTDPDAQTGGPPPAIYDGFSFSTTTITERDFDSLFGSSFDYVSSSIIEVFTFPSPTFSRDGFTFESLFPHEDTFMDEFFNLIWMFIDPNFYESYQFFSVSVCLCLGACMGSLVSFLYNAKDGKSKDSAGLKDIDDKQHSDLKSNSDDSCD